MQRTGTILLIIFIALGIYDFYCYVTQGLASTISQVMVNYLGNSPVGSFVVGCIVGHLAFPMAPNTKSKV